jgi:cell division protein FtsZ
METPRSIVIKIMGLGGGGSNAVDRMIELGLDGVEFIAANTDVQALSKSQAPNRIELGRNLTRGLGAGGKPEVGEAAAIESRNEIRDALAGADLVFLTAGMGGGTGSGAISVAAEVARSLGALTVAVVTMPFAFEASRRQQNAVASLIKLRANADTLVTVPNDKLLGLLPKTTTFELALRVADEVLRQGIQGLTELIARPGLINMDFANIRGLMETGGPSMMAIGQGSGEHKALKAVRQALQMPLLDLKSVACATGVLVHFTGGDDLSLFEVNQAASEISTAAPNAEVVFGATVDPVYTGRAQVILVATGVETQSLESLHPNVPLRRPITARVREPEPEPAAVMVEQPARAAARDGGQLAEALFSQVVPGPAAEARDPSPASAAAQNSLDLPAFLRRRRGSLGDAGGGQ